MTIDFSTMPGFYEFSAGFDYGLEFACAHLCRHCKLVDSKPEDMPERISQEQLDFILAENSKRPDDWLHTPIENEMWRHVPRKDKRSGVTITPLCEASALREARRNENES